jgi:hypothetical protein
VDKTAIRNFAVKARRKLIEDITHKAYEIGITKDKILDIETFEGGFRVKGRENGKTFKKYELKQRDKLIQNIKYKGFEQVIEEVAYTWFNRFIALRFMEVNNYLPTGVRVLSSIEEGKTEPDIIQEALNIDLDLDPEIVYRLQDSNDTEDLYRYLLVKQCNQLGKIMPNVFEEIADYTELLLPDKLLAEGSVIRDLVEEIEEYDWKIELNEEEQKQEAEKGEHGIEIIGWLYQYYISEKKDEVFAGLKKNKKITKENIPAATQLFTPKWIVKYMVENSLGRLWLESHPNEELKAQWKYYLEEAEQEPEVQKQLDELKDPNLNPEDIKVLDPAMGSGHILVYAFDVLYEIYLSAGYSEREIPTLILEKNLYGLDIDDRAGQLATFALLMKARSKNRRIFRHKPKMNLCSIQESNDIPKEAIEYLVSPKETELEKHFHREDVEYLIEVFHDAKEYGSILDVKKIDFDALEKRIEEIRNNVPEDLFELQYREIILEKIPPLIQQAKIMSQKYDVVCTNPPYMGNRGMNSKLSKYIGQHFPNTKTDFFAVFIEVCGAYTRARGLFSLITQPTWLFLSAFEKLRKSIIENKSICSLLHIGRGIFGIDWGSVAFTLRNILVNNYYGQYFRLHTRLFQYIDPNDIKDLFLKAKNDHSFKFNFDNYGNNSELFNDGKLRMIGDCNGQKIHYIYNQENFKLIPGYPIAYWANSNLLDAFRSKKIISKIAIPRTGIMTGDNARFLRLWWEPYYGKLNLDAKDYESAIKSKLKWYPYNKGGDFRRWYGNNEYVVNWENGGYEIFGCAKLDSRNSQDYPNELKFKRAISWALVSSKKPSFRIINNSLSDIGGPSLFVSSNNLYYILAFCNSLIAIEILNILNPTVNFQAGNIGNLPIILNKDNFHVVTSNAMQNIRISQQDWDSFETSWDFKVHPLANFNKYMDNYYDTLLESGILADKEPIYVANLEHAYEQYKEFTEVQFNQLKSNEEELNRIFIEIYGLQDELTPDVDDKDVTITRIYDSKEDIPECMKGNNYVLTREDVIKSFISYAVGCMFGRYSLDEEGLIYAGGDFDDKFRLRDGQWEIKTKEGWKKSRVNIVEHNVIPIVDGDYFEDGILERFVDFVKVSFGEDTLEENLDYIAETLGRKANETSRQAIRRYFLKDFYKDHVRTYKKRPIYWLFDSGRQDGFKPLKANLLAKI